MMDSAGIEQIKFNDSKFTDLSKGFEDKNNRVFGAGDMIDYGGVAFVRQDDPYRCNTGKVRVAHLFGANAFGYLDLGEAGSPTRRTVNCVSPPGKPFRAPQVPGLPRHCQQSPAF